MAPVAASGRQRHPRQPQGAGRRRPRRPRGRRCGQVATAAERWRDRRRATCEVDGQHVRGRVQRAGGVVPGLLRDLDQAGITLTSIEVRRPTLDDVFLTVTGRSLRDG